MNLRETFIWNVLVGAAALTIIYFLYLEYNNYKEYTTVWNTFEKQEQGTDKELLTQIKDLESKMGQKAENKFKFKKNMDPTDLRRVIEIEGQESYFGMAGNSIKVFGKVGDRAIVQYNGKPHKVAVGDTLSGGKIISISNEELIFIKQDGEEERHSFKRKK